MKINALKLRQSLGKIIDHVVEEQELVIIEKGHKEVAVLIPIELFRERFVDRLQDEQKRELLQLFKDNGATASTDSLSELRKLRND